MCTPRLLFPGLRFSVAATACFVAADLHAQRTPSPEAAAAPTNDVIALSPFTVSDTAEEGYVATQTLSGTRVKSDIRDLGSALTIMTEALMDDLGTTNIADIQEFAPNTSTFVNNLSDVNVNGAYFSNGNFGSQTVYVTRGGTSALPTVDFFPTRIAPDRYNTEAFTFTRGPNSILFGIGSPYGSFGAFSKRARFKRETSVTIMMDDRGTFRGTLDLNQTIAKDLFAVRYVGLYETLHGFREDNENFQRRHYVAATFTPFKTTTLRVNYSNNFVRYESIRPWPIKDGVSPWLAAGSPISQTLQNATAPRLAGIERAYAAAQLISTRNSPAGTPIATMSWQDMNRSANVSYPHFPNVNGAASLTNSSIYPILGSIYAGGNNINIFDSFNYSAFLEQKVTNDLFMEVAYNYEENDRTIIDGINGIQDILYVDVNRLLPNGAPNPNVGSLYVDSQTTMVPQPSKTDSFRTMASYDLNLTRDRGSWLRHLGKHRIAGGIEINGWRQNHWTAQVRNVTPLATTGAAANITNAANLVRFRYYVDPSSGKVSGMGGLENLPVLFKDDPLPPRDPSGVTLAWVHAANGNGVWQRIYSGVVAVQSNFLDNRLVLTNGWRKDRVTNYVPATPDYAALPGFVDNRGFGARPYDYDIRSVFPNVREEKEGNTHTLGAVLHVRPWLSLTYNTSNNFQPNNVRNVYGGILPNPEGEGKDYGVKFSLLDGKILAEVLYYKNATVNKQDNIGNSPAGDIQGRLNAIWVAIADGTDDDRYRESPYQSTGFNWSDTQTSSSSGWEGSLTANATRNWRLVLNGSKRSRATTTGRGAILYRYLDEYLPMIKGNASWMNYNIVGRTETVANYVADVEGFRRNLEALQTTPEDVYAPQWGINLITTYKLAESSLLRNFSVGGSANLRGRSIIGYAENAGVVDPKRPYYAPTHQTLGAWITYQRKIFKNRIDWRLQLNVRNLLDKNVLFPLRTVDARDGTGRGVVALYRVSEPRTFAFTSEFTF